MTVGWPSRSLQWSAVTIASEGRSGRCWSRQGGCRVFTCDRLFPASPDCTLRQDPAGLETKPWLKRPAQCAAAPHRSVMDSWAHRSTVPNSFLSSVPDWSTSASMNKSATHACGHMSRLVWGPAVGTASAASLAAPQDSAFEPTRISSITTGSRGPSDVARLAAHATPRATPRPTTLRRMHTHARPRARESRAGCWCTGMPSTRAMAHGDMRPTCPPLLQPGHPNSTPCAVCLQGG